MLNAKITGITGEIVSLQFADGQSLNVPVSAVEGTPALGMSVALNVAVPGSEDAARQALAKDILNDLLQN